MEQKVVLHRRGIKFRVQHFAPKKYFPRPAGNWLAHHPLPGSDDIGFVKPGLQVIGVQEVADGLPHRLDVLAGVSLVTHSRRSILPLSTVKTDMSALTFLSRPAVRSGLASVMNNCPNSSLTRLSSRPILWSSNLSKISSSNSTGLKPLSSRINAHCASRIAMTMVFC